MIKITPAQLYTLRCLKYGGRYKMRGDGKKGLECRPTIYWSITDDVNAPSIPPLYRMGLVDFAYRNASHHSTWYTVVITDLGRQVVEENN